MRLYRWGVVVECTSLVCLVDAARREGVDGGFGSARRGVGWERAPTKTPQLQ